jgi:hypothetical protein
VIRRLLVLITALVLLGSGCSNENIGRSRPRCDFQDGVTSEMLLQAQAVPTARYGPCVDDLPAGWSYVHQEAEAGRARFWLDSDRLGDRFAEIVLTDACSPGAVVPIASPADDIWAVAESTVVVEPVRIVIVPVGTGQRDYAAEIGVDLAVRHIEGRRIDLTLEEHGDAEDRAREALESGRFVLTIGEVNELNRTVGLQMPGENARTGMTLEDALEEIEDEVTEPRYAASWYFTFEGGCIEWHIDAKGPEVAMLSSEIRSALGFLRLDELREGAAAGGFLIGEVGR